MVKFYSLLKKDDTQEQLCYYQTGIGTYEPPSIMGGLTMWIAKLADEAVAWYAISLFFASTVLFQLLLRFHIKQMHKIGHVEFTGNWTGCPT